MVNRKKQLGHLRMHMVDVYTDDSLSGIRRIGWDPEDWGQPMQIESHLHLIVLTASKEQWDAYSYDNLTRRLGPLNVDDDFIPGKTAKFGIKYRRNYRQGIWINVFINPLYPNPCPCKIEIHQRNTPDKGVLKRFLFELAKPFPGLNVSKVEYATDVYCLNSAAVIELFEIIRRHLYIPSQRANPSTYGGQNINPEWSRVYRIGNHKIYERGKDADKKRDKGWPIRCCDRVRLEFTAKRGQLQKHGIVKIGHLVQDPKFATLNNGRRRFLNFTKSNRLPKIYDAYNIDPQNIDSFQAEHRYHRKQIGNIRQCLENTPNFEELAQALQDSYATFDEEWAQT